jgi:hypothetical protein
MGRLIEDDEFLKALAEAEADVEGALEVRESRSIASREDRRRIRALKLRKANEAKGIPYIKTSDGKWRRCCKGRNLNNEQCGVIPLKKGTVLSLPGYEETCTATGGWCMKHDPKVSDAYIAEWQSRTRGGRKRHVGPDEYMRQVVQRGVGLFMRPYLDALGIELDPDTGEPRRVEGKGAKIYGESKDGGIYFTNHDDVETQMKAADRVFDRGFGKPRTQSEISLAPTGGAQKIPSTVERAVEVAQVLAEAGALQVDAEDDDEE